MTTAQDLAQANGIIKMAVPETTMKKIEAGNQIPVVETKTGNPILNLEVIEKIQMTIMAKVPNLAVTKVDLTAIREDPMIEIQNLAVTKVDLTAIKEDQMTEVPDLAVIKVNLTATREDQMTEVPNRAVIKVNLADTREDQMTEIPSLVAIKENQVITKIKLAATRERTIIRTNLAITRKGPAESPMEINLLVTRASPVEIPMAQRKTGALRRINAAIIPNLAGSKADIRDASNRSKPYESQPLPVYPACSIPIDYS